MSFNKYLPLCFLPLFFIIILSRGVNAAPIPLDTDGDTVPDSVELWLLNKNPAMLDDVSNPVNPAVANVYLDDDGDGIPNIIEENLTHTSKNVDDTLTCLGGGANGIDLTGQWDVRISADLAQATNFQADTLTGISICHTASTLAVYDPVFGYADAVNYQVIPNLFTASWTRPGKSIAISASYSSTTGGYLGPRIEGQITINGTTSQYRADLRHILTGSEAATLNGIVGFQVRLNDQNGVAVDIAFNPVSDGTQVFIDTDMVSLTVYDSNGKAIPGYYAPSVGTMITANISTDIANYDSDGLADDKNTNIDDGMLLVVEPPVAGVGGMLRGKLSFIDVIDLDYLTSPGIDKQEIVFADVYAKYQLVRGLGVTWNTSTGPTAGIILMNVPTGVDVVNMTGPAGSGYDIGVDIIGGSSAKTMSDVSVRSRLPGFTDGEMVGLHSSGSNLHITGFTSNVPYSIAGTYTYNFSGGPGGIDPSALNVNYTVPGVLLPVVDTNNVVLDGRYYQPGASNRRTVNPLVSHTITWPHIDTGSISAALYEVRIKSETRPDASIFHMYLDAGSVCAAGVCTAALPSKTFLPNEDYIVDIRARAGTSGAANRNRSQTSYFYIRTNGVDCSSDSIPENLIASAPCGRYNKIITRQSPGEVDVTLDYMVHTPAGTPKGLIVLFAGGNGDALITGDALTGAVASASNNFLVRSAQLFANQGYLTITLDRPSDTFGQGAGAFDNYRNSMRAAVDIAKVVAVENTADLDIFLVGTSRGAISVVANYSLGTGIAIPSAVTSDPGARIYVGHALLPPETVKVPVHFLIHQNDGCSVSNPLDAPGVFSRFIGLDPLYSVAGAVNEMPTPLAGGFTLNPDPCQATTYHGFLGIENTAASSITSWLDGILASLDATYPGNSRPAVSPLTKGVYSNVIAKIDLFSLAGDVDGDMLSFALPFGTSSRSASVNIEGSVVTYTPTGETNVTDSFVYTVTDGKGGVNYHVVTLNVGDAAALTDTDGDTVVDVVDNCIQVANLNQRDTDGDLYGNACDPDFDNNGIVNASDLFYLKGHFLSTDPHADLNGDGVVNAFDLFVLKSMFLKAPGPSGWVP